MQNQFSEFDKESLAEQNNQVSIAGRIMAKRGPFLLLQDMTGRIQSYADKTTQKVLKRKIRQPGYRRYYWCSRGIAQIRQGRFVCEYGPICVADEIFASVTGKISRLGRIRRPNIASVMLT